MLHLPLKPLVPLSTLALLGWCWYTFKMKKSRIKEKKLTEGTPVSSTGRTETEEHPNVKQAANNESLSMQQDLQVALSLDSPQKHQEEGLSCPSPYSEHSISTNSHSSNDLEEFVLSGPSQGHVITSTPIVRLRPEPEGEVSHSIMFSSLVENPESDAAKEITSFGDQLEFTASEFGLVELPSAILCPKVQDVCKPPEKCSEKDTTLRLENNGVQVISVAAEELPTVDSVVAENNQMEPKETEQYKALCQKDIITENSLLLCNLFTIETESGSSVHKLSDQILIPSVSHIKDSGCSTCHSEDGAVLSSGVLCPDLSDVEAQPPVARETQTIHFGGNRKHKPSKQKPLTSKGVKSELGANAESGDFNNSTTQNSSRILWDLEVPAHLVGRLIGKQGKHIDFLKQSSGARIYVSTLPYTHDFQICHIEGTIVQVENALALVRKKFKDLDLTNRHSGVQSTALPSVPFTYWLLLPQDQAVEVIVTGVESANRLFVQQHTHPAYYALCSLNEQMFFCYSHPGCPSLPTPVEAGVLCAAPSADGSWWRAQVIQHLKDSNTVKIRYVDYGGYVTIELSVLRQIRSDFVTLPFQATEVMLENIGPLPGNVEFSVEAKEALKELTQGVALITKVTGFQNGLPLVHMWQVRGEEMISVNGLLVDHGLCSWLDNH